MDAHGVPERPRLVCPFRNRGKSTAVHAQLMASPWGRPVRVEGLQYVAVNCLVVLHIRNVEGSGVEERLGVVVSNRCTHNGNDDTGNRCWGRTNINNAPCVIITVYTGGHYCFIAVCRIPLLFLSGLVLSCSGSIRLWLACFPREKRT